MSTPKLQAKLDSEPQVILVDQHDNQVGTMGKQAAHEQALLHRAFSVFLFREHDGNLEVLLQQRASSKYHCADLWSNTCCSHPAPNETVLQAAQRRMQEELNIDCQAHNIELKKIGSFCYKVKLDNNLTEHEYDHVIVSLVNAQQNQDLDLTVYNTDEIQNLQWLKLSDLALNLQQKTQTYTPWLGLAVQLLLADPKKLYTILLNK